MIEWESITELKETHLCIQTFYQKKNWAVSKITSNKFNDIFPFDL